MKAKDIRARLADLELPDLDAARAQIAAGAADPKAKALPPDEKKQRKAEVKAEQVYDERDQQDRDWQESIIDAAIEADEGKEVRPQAARSIPTIPSYLLNRLQDKHLDELGRFGTEYTHARLKLASDLDQQYGERERQLRQDIGQLESVLSNSGRARLWWLGVTGQVPKNAKKSFRTCDEASLTSRLARRSMVKLWKKGWMNADRRCKPGTRKKTESSVCPR